VAADIIFQYCVLESWGGVRNNESLRTGQLAVNPTLAFQVFPIVGKLDTDPEPSG
jgi:hypothetical protein